MTALSQRPARIPRDREPLLARAAVTWGLCYIAYTLSAILGGPAWLTSALVWTVLVGLAALFATLALRAAYRRGQRAADRWYEPRLRELREALHELVSECDASPFVADRLARAGEQRRKLRELNDRVQSADFWGRTL